MKVKDKPLSTEQEEWFDHINALNKLKKVVKKKKTRTYTVKKIRKEEAKKFISKDVSLPFPFPLAGKPSNDIDNAIVTLDEKEYQRLREIESNIKELFILAKKVNGAVAFGRLGPQYKEPKLVAKLRELLGMEAHVQPTENSNI